MLHLAYCIAAGQKASHLVSVYNNKLNHAKTVLLLAQPIKMNLWDQFQTVTASLSDVQQCLHADIHEHGQSGA